MQLKSTDKHIRRYGFFFGLVVFVPIFPGKGHFSIFDVHDSIIGNCNTMDVSSQLVKNMLGTFKRLFGIYHPVFVVQWRAEFIELIFLRQVLNITREFQLSFLMRLLEEIQKFPSEGLRKRFYMEKKIFLDTRFPTFSFPGGSPFFFIREQCSRRNDDMQMA
jgi:hypothetical protein